MQTHVAGSVINEVVTCATAAAARIAACVAGFTAPLVATCRAVALVVVPTIWSSRAMAPSLKYRYTNSLLKLIKRLLPQILLHLRTYTKVKFFLKDPLLCTPCRK